MYTLGINAAFHDPAACLVSDGMLVAAVEEERFTRIKHGKRPIPFSAYELPFHSIDYCLASAGIRLGDVDHIAYSFDPYSLLSKKAGAMSLVLPLSPSAEKSPSSEWESPWEGLFLSHIVNAPRHFVGGVPHHLQGRFFDRDREPHYQWHFVPHHLAHAASAFLVSPFEKAAILTLDGRGEKATTSYGRGGPEGIESLGQVCMPHSLGIFYEKVTEYLGFLHSSDEYKVMALASFGKPRYLQRLQELIHIGDHGQYEMAAYDLTTMFGPPRRRGEPLEQRHFDLASSLQLALEETVLHLLAWLYSKADSENLTLAGGVALNCVMNSKLRAGGAFRNVWVQPAAGDAGTALGAAFLVDGQTRFSHRKTFIMDHTYWGPQYPDADIEELLQSAKIKYRKVRDIPRETAAALARNKIVGWFQGRMEFGPRALGARSILASPCAEGMQERLNALKEREDFRPVAPVVLQEKAAEWFVRGDTSPFMLFVYDVAPAKIGKIPAVRHVDGTARIQTITRAQHPLYYDVVAAFYALTGVPILVNTSFNISGEPIVCSPKDAIKSFWLSPLDLLVIGSFIVEKEA